MEIGDIRYIVQPCGVIQCRVSAIKGNIITFEDMDELGHFIVVNCTSPQIYVNYFKANSDWINRYGRK